MSKKDKELILYNTLTGKKEKFKSLVSGQIKIYACGPTLYNYMHIGNIRTFLVEDVLVKIFLFLGYKVHYVMNFTDVDDKTIKKSIAENKSLHTLTQEYEKAFFEDITNLNFRKADFYPRATSFIQEIIECIQILIQKNHAYQGEDGSVYFSIYSFEDYGNLSHIQKDELIEGASHRIFIDEYQKEKVGDFVLWKARKPQDGDNFWNSPWGEGRPGWHIECTVMSYHYLGNSFDLHCGGVDNKFPHHENEIAQSISAYGGHFASFFFHVAHLKTSDQKMSKSLGNTIYLKDLLLSGISSQLVRYALLTSHYRQELVFSDKLIRQSTEALNRIWDFVLFLNEKSDEEESQVEVSRETAMQVFKDMQIGFETSLLDDLNFPKAMGFVFSAIRQWNKNKTMLSLGVKNFIYQYFLEIDKICGFLIPQNSNIDLTEEQVVLLEKRQKFREEKQWEEADKIRLIFLKEGIEVKDTKEGQICKKI